MNSKLHIMRYMSVGYIVSCATTERYIVISINGDTFCHEGKPPIKGTLPLGREIPKDTTLAQLDGLVNAVSVLAGVPLGFVKANYNNSIVDLESMEQLFLDFLNLFKGPKECAEFTFHLNIGNIWYKPDYANIVWRNTNDSVYFFYWGMHYIWKNQTLTFS